MPTTNDCKNCGNNRDFNNNYIPYMNGNYTPTSHNHNKKSSNGFTSNASASPTMTHVTAKVMWGSIGAIQELREKEQAEKNSAARSGRRQ